MRLDSVDSNAKSCLAVASAFKRLNMMGPACIATASGQTACHVVRINEGIDVQRCHDGVSVRGFACDVRAGENHKAGCMQFRNLVFGLGSKTGM